MNRCPHCGDQLLTSPNGIDIFCFKPDCQRKETVERLKRERAADELNKQRVSAICEEDLTENTDLAEVFIVPAYLDALSTLSEQRKSQFIMHLSKVYQALVDDEPFQNYPYSALVDDPIKDDVELNLSKACSTCQGQCCGEGKEHAFVDKASLAYRFSKGRVPPLETLIDSYQKLFPTKTYQNGCVFQASTGCTLPKKQRALTCNRYLCKSLVALKDHLVTETPALTYIGAMKEQEIYRTAILD